jgi:hypothetical protein
MTKYRIYENYTYSVCYEVESNNKLEAIEMILDDPYEYRIPEDFDHVLSSRDIEELDIDALMHEAYEGVEEVKESELEEYSCPSCGKLKCNGYCDK